MKNLKNIKVYALALLLAFGAGSCGDFGDVNIDPKRPLTAEDTYLFSAATKQFMDWHSNQSVNSNLGRYWAQYWSAVTYTSESRYVIADRQVPDNMWVNLYRNTLRDLLEAKTLAQQFEGDPDVLANKEAIATTLEILACQMLVDMFGDVPYSEALDGVNNPSPAYDDDSGIYTDLISRLNVAIGQFVPSAGGFGSGDLIFDDDVAAWEKLAHSLMLRLAIRISDVDNGQASSLIASHYADAFSSNADNATLEYLEGTVNGNPLYNTLVVSGRDDHVPSETLVDQMNRLNDPRRPFYMDEVDGAGSGNGYVGLTYGLEAGSVYSNFSHISAKMRDPEFPGEFMTYAEVAFILAEAAQRGYSVGQSAEQWYDEAVTASIEWWGGTAADATTYLGQADVAFTTAEGGDAMHAIALQKWIALYNDGHQGMLEWRRLDWPTLVPPENMTQADIPQRMLYPINEPSLNGSNYDAASSAIGGDTYQTKVFWDVN